MIIITPSHDYYFFSPFIIIIIITIKYFLSPFIHQETSMYGYARDVYTAVPVGNGVPQGGAVPQAPLRHQYVGHTYSYPIASQWTNRTESPGSNHQGYGTPQAAGDNESCVPNFSTSSSQPVLYVCLIFT